MLVKEVMTSPAITVTAHMSVKDGLKLLDKFRVTSLPVTNSRGHLVGVVSEADLLRDAVRSDDRVQIIHHDRVEDRPRIVEDVMSRLSMSVTGESDLSEAVELMTTTAVKSLPVVDGERVIGIVSRSDIVHLLARSDDRIRTEVDDLLRSAGIECEVAVTDGTVRLEHVEDPALWRTAEVVAGSVQGVMSVDLEDGRGSL